MRIACAVALLGLCGCATPATPGNGSRTPPDAGALPSGRLGHALGTYLTIEGARAEQGKVGTRTLTVDTVDGMRLAPAVGVRLENIKDPGLPPGVRCVVRGYESGRMIGLPEAVAAAERMGTPQAGYQFSRYFIVTSVVEPESLETEGSPASR